MAPMATANHGLFLAGDVRVSGEVMVSPMAIAFPQGSRSIAGVLVLMQLVTATVNLGTPKIHPAII